MQKEERKGLTHDSYYRDSWVEVNLDHIEFNIRQLQERLLPGTKIFAVVKANAYGHGSAEVARRALEAGADRLAVSLLDEAIQLRKHGIEAPVLVMGRVRPEDTPLAAEHQIAVTFYEKEWLEQVKVMNLPETLLLHMKWDTGMGRIGIREKQELIDLLTAFPKKSCRLEGIFTHFATADEENLDYFHLQESRFESLYTVLKEYWETPVIIHTGNSAASMRFPEKMHHYVRFGISLYGLYPSGEVKKERPIALKPAFSLHSKLVHVKKLPPGEAISYGGTYRTEKEEWIGTVPLGYADGVIRKLQGKEILVGGKRVPIVGRICMDQFMVRLDGYCPAGTKVTIIGNQGDEEVSMDETAAYLETINYEIPCLISQRVPRLYLEDREIVAVRNYLT